MVSAVLQEGRSTPFHIHGRKPDMTRLKTKTMIVLAGAIAAAGFSVAAVSVASATPAHQTVSAGGVGGVVQGPGW